MLIIVNILNQSRYTQERPTCLREYANPLAVTCKIFLLGETSVYFASSRCSSSAVGRRWRRGRRCRTVESLSVADPQE